MRQQIVSIGALLGTAVLGIGARVDAAANVFYAYGATNAAYWTEAADASGAPGSPAAIQSNSFGSTSSTSYLAGTWSYSRPDSHVSAFAAQSTQQAYSTGSLPVLSVQENGNFQMQAHTMGGAAADYPNNWPPVPLMNLAMGEADFSFGFDVTTAQQFELSGNFTTDFAQLGILRMTLTRNNLDGTQDYQFPVRYADDNWAFDLNYPVEPGYRYNLAVSVQGGSLAATNSPGSAGLLENSGDLSLIGTFAPVPEPTVAAMLLMATGGLMIRRRQAKA